MVNSPFLKNKALKSEIEVAYYENNELRGTETIWVDTYLKRFGEVNETLSEMGFMPR